MQDRLLTHEVAHLLRCTPDNVRAMARKGRFRTELVGGIRLFSRREVEQVLAERKTRPSARQPTKIGVP